MLLSKGYTFTQYRHLFELDLARSGSHVYGHLEIALEAVDPKEVDAVLALIPVEVVKFLYEHLHFLGG